RARVPARAAPRRPAPPAFRSRRAAAARQAPRGQPATGVIMDTHEQTHATLKPAPRTWVVTGVAGFIGSNLLEALLKLDQKVIGLDNFSTGHRGNLAQVKDLVTERQWSSFRFIEGDVRSLETCRRACRSAHIVLHQAALGSVPRSIENPIGTHDSNV